MNDNVVDVDDDSDYIDNDGLENIKLAMPMAVIQDNVDVNVDVDDDSDYIDGDSLVIIMLAMTMMPVKDSADVDIDGDVDDDSDYIAGDGLHTYLGSKGFGFQVKNKH